jgi:hypothetical protein
MTVSRPQKLSTLLAALATATFVAAHAAHAFSIDPQSGTNADGSAKFVDPGDEIKTSMRIRGLRPSMIAAAVATIPSHSPPI